MTPDAPALLLRLHMLLEAEHQRWGVHIDPFTPETVPEDLEVHRVGETGVLAFIGDYVLTAWPDAEQRAASRDAFALLWKRLRERGVTRHIVYPRNFRSVKLTRRLGAKPKGVDGEGFVHYELRRADFERHVPGLRPKVEEIRHG